MKNRFWGVGASGVTGLLVLLGSAVVAQSAVRVEALNWAHQDPDSVEGFEVRWGTAPGVHDQTTDVGYVFSHDLVIDDSQNFYAVVVAYSGGATSPATREVVFSPSDPPGGGPPDPRWAEDFDQLPSGFAIPNWVDTESNNGAINDSLFEVADLGGEKVLFTASTSQNINSHLAISGSSQWRDYKIRGRLLITNANGRIGVTSHSQYASEDEYFGIEKRSNGEFELAFRPADSNCEGVSTGVVPQANTWYWFELDVFRFGPKIVRAKVWADGAPEPSHWQIACADLRPSLPDTGTIGVWSSGSGNKQWDDLAVTFAPELQGGAARAATILVALLAYYWRRRA